MAKITDLNDDQNYEVTQLAVTTEVGSFYQGEVLDGQTIKAILKQPWKSEHVLNLLFVETNKPKTNNYGKRT